MDPHVLELYRAWCAADDRLQVALVAKFKGAAGDRRYYPSTYANDPALAALAQSMQDARGAYYSARDAQIRMPCGHAATPDHMRSDWCAACEAESSDG